MRTLLALLLAGCCLRAAIPPVQTYDSEAYTWSTNVVGNGGVLSAVAYRVGSTYMIQAKQWGLRPLLKRVNLFVGNDTNALKVCIIKDWGSGNDGLNNFTAADFSETVGLTGDGLTKSLGVNGATGLAFGALTTTTNYHHAAYVRTASSQVSCILGAQDNFSNPLIFLAVSYGTDTYNMIGSFTCNTTDTTGTGFYCGTRRSSTDMSTYKNGVELQHCTTSDTVGFPNPAVLVFALNQGGAAVLFNSRTLSYYAFGLAIPDAMAKTSYYALVQNAQIPLYRQK